MCDDSMTKNLKPDEVISLITKKVQLKKDLRELRKNKEVRWQEKNWNEINKH